VGGSTTKKKKKVVGGLFGSRKHGGEMSDEGSDGFGSTGGVGAVIDGEVCFECFVMGG
jgi:hypothetical protein